MLVEIDYPVERMAANARRIDAAMRLAPVDRTPVLVGAYDRYYLALRGVSHGELYRDPETYLYHKIMNQVWAIQNMPDDRCQAPRIEVAIDLGNHASASAFGAHVVWEEDEPPWSEAALHSPEEIGDLQIPPPDAGMWGQMLAWYESMQGHLAEYRLLFNGQEAPIIILPPDPGTEGPFTIARDLVGPDLYLWLKTEPHACHDLMDKITTGLIRAHQYVRRLFPKPVPTRCAVVNDAAELLSPDMFREFCVPYDNRIYDTLGVGIVDGRSKHMCGKIDHLLPILTEEERITSLWGFGDGVDPQLVASAAAGRFWVQGNVSPVLLLKGGAEEVVEAARKVLAAFAPCGGLILADGFNVAPGTPLENIAALVQASEEWGPVG